jgi:hypothetical protein
MKKFYRTKFTVTLVSRDQPFHLEEVNDLVGSIRENSDDLIPTCSDVKVSRISSRAAARFATEHGFDTDLKEIFELNEDGTDIVEQSAGYGGCYDDGEEEEDLDCEPEIF